MVQHYAFTGVPVVVELASNFRSSLRKRKLV